MQKGGLPIFKVLPSCKIRGAGFLGSVIGKIGFKHMAKLTAKKFLPKIGKHVKEKIAPEILSAALESGKSVLSGGKNLKKAMKSGIKKAKKNILNVSKTVLKDKIAWYQKGEPLWQLNKKTPEPNQEEYTCRVIKAVEEESKFLVDSPPKNHNVQAFRRNCNSPSFCSSRR